MYVDVFSRLLVDWHKKPKAEEPALVLGLACSLGAWLALLVFELGAITSNGRLFWYVRCYNELGQFLITVT
jgi:hypothetical protein